MPALPEEADDAKQLKWTFENSARPRECHEQVLYLLQGAPDQSKGHCVRSGAQKGKGPSKMPKLSFRGTTRQVYKTASNLFKYLLSQQNLSRNGSYSKLDNLNKLFSKNLKHSRELLSFVINLCNQRPFHIQFNDLHSAKSSE